MWRKKNFTTLTATNNEKNRDFYPLKLPSVPNLLPENG